MLLALEAIRRLVQNNLLAGPVIGIIAESIGDKGGRTFVQGVNFLPAAICNNWLFIGIGTDAELFIHDTLNNNFSIFTLQVSSFEESTWKRFGYFFSHGITFSLRCFENL